ncbi:MAG: hypothetical protein K9I29_01425 [Bacteroidales bacterium]|nr:hypothetical protein [Bacteroidales bacterium]MCF8326930.1 hypothetical protein [Bacteroidales bacterium]
MKNRIISLIVILFLSSCNMESTMEKIIPTEVDSFARQFISDVQNGDISHCLTKVSEKSKNEGTIKFLTNTSANISSYNINSLRMINARQTREIGKNPVTNYYIEYEQEVADGFLLFMMTIRKSKGTLKISKMDGRLMESSLSEINRFTFINKSFRHYLFFTLLLLTVGFIVITLITAIRTKLKFKWLWIIGILIAFVKFELNWTTGELGFQPLSFQLLGAGFTKSGLVAPWMLSFSIPLVAFAFWVKKYQIKRASKETQRFEQTIGQDKE